MFFFSSYFYRNDPSPCLIHRKNKATTFEAEEMIDKETADMIDTVKTKERIHSTRETGMMIGRMQIMNDPGQ